MNGVVGAAMGVKDVVVYTRKVQTGQTNLAADVVQAVNGVSSSVNRFLNKPIGDQVKLLTSPQAYGALVGFFALGGAKFTKGSTLTSTINNTYKAKSFAQIIDKAADITKKGATETSMLVEGSVSEAFGGLMKQYGKTADDLVFKKTKDGFSYRFTTDKGETFSLYHQASKDVRFVDLTISRTVKGEKSTKVRFSKN